MQKNILSALEKTGEMRCDFDSTAKSDQVSEPVTFVIVCDAGNAEKLGTLALGASRIVGKFADV